MASITADILRLGTTRFTMYFNLQRSLLPATSTQIKVYRPDKTEVTWTGTFFNKGTGIISYSIQPNDFNIKGDYLLVVVVYYDDGKILTKTKATVQVIDLFDKITSAVYKLRKGTTKLQFKFSLGVDLSTATAANIKIKKPNGQVDTRTLEIVAPATTGLCQYDMSSSDFTVAGAYIVVVYVTYPTGIVYAKEETQVTVMETYE